MSFGTFTSYENQTMIRLENQEQHHSSNHDHDHLSQHEFDESQNNLFLQQDGEPDFSAEVTGGGASSDSNINLAAQMAMEALKENIQEQQDQQDASSTARPLEANDRLNHQGLISPSGIKIHSSLHFVGANSSNEVASSSTTTFMANEFPYYDVGKSGSTITTAPTSHKEPEIIFKIVDGKFECPREGCGKLYKNKNGLKYHLTKGLCNGSFDVVGADGKLVDGSLPTPDQSKSSSPRHTNAPRLKKEDFANDPEAYARYKPFWCRKCSKRYKNINGLRYHAKVEHSKYAFDDIKGQILGV